MTEWFNHWFMGSDERLKKEIVEHLDHVVRQGLENVRKAEEAKCESHRLEREDRLKFLEKTILQQSSMMTTMQEGNELSIRNVNALESIAKALKEALSQRLIGS